MVALSTWPRPFLLASDNLRAISWPAGIRVGTEGIESSTRLGHGVEPASRRFNAILRISGLMNAKSSASTASAATAMPVDVHTGLSTTARLRSTLSAVRAVRLTASSAASRPTRDLRRP